MIITPNNTICKKKKKSNSEYQEIRKIKEKETILNKREGRITNRKNLNLLIVKKRGIDIKCLIRDDRWMEDPNIMKRETRVFFFFFFLNSRKPIAKTYFGRNKFF